MEQEVDCWSNSHGDPDWCFLKMETFFYSQAHYRKIIHCLLVSTVLLYSLVHSGLLLSKKLIGILLHLDIQMKQNTIQLVRQTETAVYQ